MMSHASLAQVHRLDSEMGGLLMVAKTRHALRALSGAFGAREVGKQFTALVGGRLQVDPFRSDVTAL